MDLNILFENIQILQEFQKEEFKADFVLNQAFSKNVDLLPLSEAIEKKIITISEIGEFDSRPNIDSIPNRPRRGIPRQIDNLVQQRVDISSSGQVNALLVENKSDQYIIGFRGDILVGGMQNRVLITTIIFEPQKTVKIPVSCVERGRWRYEKTQDRKFKYKTKIPSLLRAKMSQQEISGRSRHDYVRNISNVQQSVWGGIHRRMERYEVQSDTENVIDIMKKQRKYEEPKIDVPDEANGISISYEKNVISGEFYAKNLVKKNILDSLKSALIDYEYYKTSKTKAHPNKYSFHDVIKDLKNGKITKKESIGAEEIYTIEGNFSNTFLVTFKDIPVYMEFTVKDTAIIE